MDFAAIQAVLGLAANAVGLTKEAASTVAQVKQAVASGDGGKQREAQELLNTLATHLTVANFTNVQLSTQLKALTDALLSENEFEERKKRYQLAGTGYGEMIFVLRTDAANGDPPHYVCPICLEKERRFHFVTGPENGEGKNCQGCRHYFQFRPSNPSRRGGHIV